jgi:SAM-dependent methyltransferase
MFGVEIQTLIKQQDETLFVVLHQTKSSMKPLEPQQEFISILHESFKKNLFLKLTLGKPASKSSDLKNIFIRPVEIKGEKLLNFTFRYATKDIAKNLDIAETENQLKDLLPKSFLHATLFTQNNDFRLVFNKKRKSTLLTQKPSLSLLQEFKHDRVKSRLIDPVNNVYLQKLGVTGENGKVFAGMSDKYRQINRYVEIVDGALSETNEPATFKVVDMGSGKGYLTFALYDHLKNNRQLNVDMTGVEIRPDLVKLCNLIAGEAKFDGLKFEESNIADFQMETIDMLIALHACDTATDDAIYKGIKAGAKYIIVAPCCQKQIRKQIHPENEMKPILKNGIFLERQAEMITDGIRALIMEMHGYQCKVIEFISTEHTPKNVMIIGRKSTKKPNVKKISEQILNIKQSFGIEFHQLEKLLG